MFSDFYAVTICSVFIIFARLGRWFVFVVEHLIFGLLCLLPFFDAGGFSVSLALTPDFLYIQRMLESFVFLALFALSL